MGEIFAGRYELIDPIGRGGAGAVWRAWDHRRRRYVAAKVLLQSDAHTLLRFVREQALRIDHPHVLAPASWAADDDKVLFTMDLVAGGSLAHVIGDYGALPPRFVCTLLDQLLSGLAAVHAEGVVHRDIKPANILMEATGTGRPHLRLSDFGIAMRKGEPRLTETAYVVGTPGYLAPEQLLGSEPDFTADLFAVGLVGLYLLKGAKPDSQALVEQFFAHGTPDAPEGVPAPLWDVLAALLQPDPRSRFQTATGARRALAEAVELLPPPGPDGDPGGVVEVFDQLGPVPAGFTPQEPRGPQAPRPSQPATDGDADAHRTEHRAAHEARYQAQYQAPYETPPTAPHGAPAVSVPAQPADAPTPVTTPLGVFGPSETGSFHLPPPVHAATPTPQAPQTMQTMPTAPYPYAQPPTQPAPPAAPRTTALAPPPAKVTAGILLAAVLCFAVGIWALTQM
ncbi:protein kinase [Streptomyces sp. NPDC059957]|uniref:serine/threonine-protein kinase n=1 Tax=unclassified Streptomyces TaxID=2593676 RepID=UPI00365E1920